MPKTSIPINNFNGGEINAGLLDTRFDINKYYSSCKTLENALPLVEGGAKKMPGTYYSASAASSTSKSRLKDFSFSTDQNYILEFSDKILRIFKDGGLITFPTSYSNYDPAHSYIGTEVVCIGNYFYYTIASKTLYITAQYGQSLGNTNILFAKNTSDNLAINKSGETNYQIITIEFANYTLSKNAASLIQAGIRALGTINGIDLSGWTVTPNSAYYAEPWYEMTTPPPYIYMNKETTKSGYYLCIGANQYKYFPADSGSSDKWETTSTPTESASTITTPYLEDDLFDLDLNTQSADVLFIFHHSYPAMTLSRYADNYWALNEITFTGSPDVVQSSYGGLAKPIQGITNAAAGVVTVAAHGYLSGDTIYINHCLGMTEVNQGEYTVTYIDADSFSIDADTTNFGAYTSGGWSAKIVTLFNYPGMYPACGTLYQGRLVLGGFDLAPLKIYGSVVDDFYNFTSDPELDDYAFIFTLVSQKVDSIRRMLAQTQLILCTSGGICIVQGSGDSPLTQTNIDTNWAITIGTGNVAPQKVNDAVVWITRYTGIVRLLKYSFLDNQWLAPDLTRLARHITRGASAALSGIKQTAFQAEPYPIFWAVRADGQLIGMTFESQDQVNAWFRIVTDGEFESVAVISNDNEEDEVWISVKRELDSGTVRYIEYFKPHEIYSEITDGFFVHSGLTWDGGAAKDISGITKADPAVVTATAHGFSNGDTVWIKDVVGMTEINTVDNTTAYLVANKTTDTFELSGIDSSTYTAYSSGGTVQKVKRSFTTGLDHLEGKDVAICVDGAAHIEETVTSGSVTLDYYGNKIHIGLHYDTIIEPMNPYTQGQTGSIKGKKQKIHRVTLCFYESVGCKLGRNQDNLSDVTFGTGDQPDLYTGDKVVDIQGDWDINSTISIVHDEPLPFTLKAVIPDLNANES